MKKVLHFIGPVIFIAAAIFVIGAPGAVDAGNISMTRMFVQMLIGLAVCAGCVAIGRAM